MNSCLWQQQGGWVGAVFTLNQGFKLDSIVGIQASQTDQQTAVWRLRFKGKSLDSYKSQIDTPASVGGVSSWHTAAQMIILNVSDEYSYTKSTPRVITPLQEAISDHQLAVIEITACDCVEGVTSCIRRLYFIESESTGKQGSSDSRSQLCLRLCQKKACVF